MAAATHITAVTPITTAIIPRIRLALGTIRTIRAAPAARGGKCDVHLCYGRARHAGRAGSPGGREVGPGLLRRCRERGAEALPSNRPTRHRAVRRPRRQRGADRARFAAWS